MGIVAPFVAPTLYSTAIVVSSYLGYKAFTNVSSEVTTVIDKKGSDATSQV
jgi:hypothetical protein